MKAGGACQLTVLALDLGDSGDVASSEGVGMSSKEEEDSQPHEEGRHLEGGHGDVCAAGVPDDGQLSLNIAGAEGCV